VLKELWENDIVEEDLIEAWHENETAVREVLQRHFNQDAAYKTRRSCDEFIRWVQAGEEG
jgi:hypothetical protein